MFGVEERRQGSASPEMLSGDEYSPPLVFSVIKEFAFTKRCDH